MSNPKIAFEMRKVRLSLAAILPVHQIKDTQKTVTRYKTIVASIKEIGLVEPLVVYPQKEGSGKYLLLEGHLRYFALKDLGETEADCIIATDDECFTYNARVNRLNPIQEHKMIVKAVSSGVKPEKIAAALNLPLRDVKASISLLDGINAEAADLLKDKSITPKAALLVAPTPLRIPVIAALCLLSLAALGAFGGYLGGAPLGRATLRVTLGGALAMAVTALIGRILGVAVG
jgi:ParB-like chromosome segregation protein Spo0J